MHEKPYILLSGCFDTNGSVFSYWNSRISRNSDFAILSVDTGVFDAKVDFRIDFDSDQVARKGGGELSSIRDEKDRGKAVDIMGNGAAKICSELVEQYSIGGIVSAGGG